MVTDNFNEEEQAEAKKLFDDTLGSFKLCEHKNIQEAQKQIEEKYGHYKYDIPIAFNHHIQTGKLFLTIYNGELAIARGFE